MKAQKKPMLPKKTLFLHKTSQKTDKGKTTYETCPLAKDDALSPFCLGDEATNFWVSSTKFQLPNNFPRNPFFSRYLLPEKGRKNHPPHLYIGACPVKTKKGTPCSLTLTGVPEKEKDTNFLLVWSAKFGGYDIEYPLFWQKNHSKITENFCGNPRSNAERVPQGKITGKNSGKKKREVQGFLLPQIFWFPDRRSRKRP